MFGEPINTETGNSKYSPNTLCSITFKSHFLGGGSWADGLGGGKNILLHRES